MSVSGFPFEVVRREVSYRTNYPNPGLTPEYSDTVVDGADFAVNASHYAAELRTQPHASTVVFFVRQGNRVLC